MSARPLRILVVAPERHALRQPHAGGLEAVVWDRVRWLRGRGHDVLLCAASGSDFLGGRPEHVLPSPRWATAWDASDSDYPEGHRREIAAAFDRVLAGLALPCGRVDVVDNHSLHAAPVRWSEAGIPVVTTLHTPPLPEIVVAAPRRIAGRPEVPHRFVAVSRHTARAWSAEGVHATVLPNGVDTARWRLGVGGPTWVWFGRIVPEKAPHLAIRAALRAGASLVLAGRIGDADYFARTIAPALGERVTYAGPLRQPQLAALVGAAAVALVTPMWSEPFGLVLAEALSTGTPVAAFDAGGVREVLRGIPSAVAVPAGDVDALAAAGIALAAHGRDRAARTRTRRAALAQHSLERRYRDIEHVLRLTAGAAARALPEAAGVGE